MSFISSIVGSESSEVSRKKDALSILRYWRDVEFFRPFDFDEVLNRYPNAYRITSTSGVEPTKIGQLPWDDFQAAGLNPEYIYAFDLFFGVFSVRNALRIVSTSVPRADNPLPDYRSWELPGLSCTGRLTVTSEGLFAPADLKVSTLPWAIGRVSNQQNRSLQQFDSFAEGILDSIELISAQHTQEFRKKLVTFPTLETLRKICLLPQLSQDPHSSELFLDQDVHGIIIPIRIKRRSAAAEIRSDADGASSPQVSAPQVSVLEASNVSDGALDNDDKAEEVEGADPGEISEIARKRKIEILNSFFLRDLERGYETISANPSASKTVLQYLDLDNKEEKADCRLDVRPPNGRSSKCSSKRSSKFEKVRSGLLKSERSRLGRWPCSPCFDLAENQALALGLYQCSKNRHTTPELREACIVAVNGPPGTGKTTLVRELCASLVVERAVAMANLKTPVEAFEPRPAEFSVNGRGRSYRYRVLSPKIRGFGILITSSNNSAVENVSKELPSMKSLAPEFSDFRYLEECTARYRAFASSVLQMPGAARKETDWWGLPSIALGKRQNRNNLVYGLLLDPRGESDEENFYRTKKLQQLTLTEWRNQAPPIGKLSFRAAQREFLELHKLVMLSVRRIDRCNVDGGNVDCGNTNFSNRLADDSTSAIELNALKSKLFCKALELQEAWLREVPNLESDLNALAQWLKRPEAIPSEAAEALLELVFMVSPVASTTLASVERMCATLGPGSIANAIIDEAGQAAPQNAVGLIFRSKRVLVVGDQRQLEPVPPIPSSLDDYLHAQVPESVRRYSRATSNSVQSLVDQNAVIGTSLPESGNASETWVGLPLIEHRRCEEPMFSVCNQIAYGGMMQYATTYQPLRAVLSSSCWIDIKGVASDKHWVAEQGHACAALLEYLVDASPQLSSFVITPFRRVSERLNSVIREVKASKTPSILDSASRLVGTIHTFQGREADVVILVLGCDSTSQGAADWAGERPNLINVAVSRAKRLLYVIGDVDLWHRRGYFSDLQKALPIRTLADVLSQPLPDGHADGKMNHA